jgi:hypothetical protein
MPTGFRVVDGRLGRDDQQPDRARVDVRRAQAARRGRRRERDDVLARRRERHRLDAEPLRELLGRDAARRRERGQRQRELRHVRLNRFDPDAHDASPSRARYWPSAISGK